jgi:hypothetical protein
MKMMKFLRLTKTAALLTIIAGATPVLAQSADVITIGSVVHPGPSIVVPVYVRDLAGTPLGMDQPAGSRIQSLSIKVDYAPAAPIDSVTFTRAGITAALTPTLELTPSAPGSITLLVTFPEATQLVPFNQSAAAPGDLIGQLSFNLAPGAAPGTVITLTLDPSLTQLTDEGGSGETKQTVADGTLLLIGGTITVMDPAEIPTMAEWALILLALALAATAVVTLRS